MLGTISRWLDRALILGSAVSFLYPSYSGLHLLEDFPEAGRMPLHGSGSTAACRAGSEAYPGCEATTESVYLPACAHCNIALGYKCRKSRGGTLLSAIKFRQLWFVTVSGVCAGPLLDLDGGGGGREMPSACSTPPPTLNPRGIQLLVACERLDARLT